jgi:hypothetical protein
MSSVASYVGATPIPFPAGSTPSPLSDPIVDAFLSYFGHWLRYGLNDKLASLGGQATDTADVYNDACPVANRFPYSHENVWPNNPRPALYMRFNGQAQMIQKTLSYSLRQRTIEFAWIFSLIKQPKSVARSGLLAAVDDIFARAHDRGSHPTWTFTDFEGTVYPAGTNVGRVAGLHDWQLGPTQTGNFAPVASFGDDTGREQNFYPALVGTIVIWKRIGADSFDRQTDANTETTIEINTSENGGFVQEPLTIAETIVLKP